MPPEGFFSDWIPEGSELHKAMKRMDKDMSLDLSPRERQNITKSAAEDVAMETTSKRPDRQTVISSDDEVNLKIALETMTIDDIINSESI